MKVTIQWIGIYMDTSELTVHSSNSYMVFQWSKDIFLHIALERVSTIEKYDTLEL